MGLQYSNSLFASSQYLPIPSVALHLRKRWKRNILINGKRNGARSPYVSFLETRNAQGGTFIVSWKRNTRKIRVCFLCFLFPVFRLRPYLVAQCTVHSTLYTHLTSVLQVWVPARCAVQVQLVWFGAPCITPLLAALRCPWMSAQCSSRGA